VITAWEEYLSPNQAAGAYSECRRRCRSAFDRQRACIERIFEARPPKVIACLGAGVLNDIPYWHFTETNATLHLVDWLRGIAEFGVANSILRRDAGRLPQCVYCGLADVAPETYCHSYRQADPQGAGVCEPSCPTQISPTCAWHSVKAPCPTSTNRT
jgi:hypothetical protein